MSALSITPLGTNGFIPTYGRQTMSYLVRREGRVLVLDAGSGLARLLEWPLKGELAGAERFDILLTHYHLDHVVGLSYLPEIAGTRPVTLWGPAPPLTDFAPEEALGRLIAPPLFPLTLDAFPCPVTIRAYSGESLEVAGASLRLRRQRHSGGSVGVVIDGRLGYLTDCEVDEGSAAFARGPSGEGGTGLELLLHEVWVTDEEAAAGAHRKGHSTIEEVARLADACGAAALMPIHHRPHRTATAVAEMARRLAARTRARVVLPVEGHEYPLPLPVDG